MDSTLSAHPLAAHQDLVTTFWRIVGPSHVPLTCALHRTMVGLELRICYDQGDLVRATIVAREDVACKLAAGWRAALMAVGSFVDVDSHT